MKRVMQAGALGVAALLLLAVAPAGTADAAKRLWDPRPVPAGVSTSPEAIRATGLRPDFAFLDQEADSVFTLMLPDGDSLDVRRLGRDRPGAGRLLWRGRVAGDPFSDVIFSRVRDVVVGTITTSRGRRWRLRYAGAGEHLFEEIRAADVPDEGTASLVPLSTGGPSEEPTCDSDRADQVDVLVLYTAAALAGAGGTDAMEATIHMFVGATNQSFVNSGIAPRIRLVHMTQTDYVEDSDFIGDDLDFLVYDDGGGPGTLDDVFDLRDAFGADLVVLVAEVRDDSSVGLAKPMRVVSNAHEAYAFAVVDRAASETQFTFAHEIGHLFAADHERADPSTAGPGHPYDYNFGYLWTPEAPSTTTGWRTMMAIGEDCAGTATTPATCPRLLYWSNPDIPRDGVDMGIAVGEPDAADNRTTLNTTAGVVANFRCATPTREDAWLKDAWSDSGLEPEPALEGEPVWKSPYIWVRRVADPDRLHAHEHENPRAGSTSYAYVKIHGGTSDLAGTLRLYAANASSGTRWPDDWEEVGAVALEPLEAYDTRILEFPWTPTSTGHYCLLARWVCDADPMALAEVPRIATNVRANNNIVWRNLNVLVPGTDGSASATFMLRNVESSNETYSISVKMAGRGPGPAFLRTGRIRLRLDPAIAQEWLREGARGSGFVVRDDAIVMTDPRGAVISNLRMRGRAATPVTVELAGRGGKEPRLRALELDIVQTRTTQGRSEIVGGVSYLLQGVP